MARIGSKQFFASVLSVLFLFTVVAVSGALGQQGQPGTAGSSKSFGGSYKKKKREKVSNADLEALILMLKDQVDMVKEQNEMIKEQYLTLCIKEKQAIRPEETLPDNRPKAL